MNVRKRLEGGDLRSIGNVQEILPSINTQEQFDVLFKNLLSHERIIAMRSADAVEKLTRKNPQWLGKHKHIVLELLHHATKIELKWHLAQLAPRLELSDKELYFVWDKLAFWMLNKNESKVVRVNSLQALYTLSLDNQTLNRALISLVNSIRQENIPSLKARIKKLHL